MNRSSAQLEREAERTRRELADTLEELRSRITPGQLVDQAADYARETDVGAFLRNLGREARDNPLPVALIGAGIAWLMLSEGRRHRLASGSIRHDAGDLSASVAASAEGLKPRRADPAEHVGDSTAAAGRGVLDSARGFIDYCREEPLVLAGIGLAIGAAIGAALPATATENRLMRQASSEAVNDGDARRDAERQGFAVGSVVEAVAAEASIAPAAPNDRLHD